MGHREQFDAAVKAAKAVQAAAEAAGAWTDDQVKAFDKHLADASAAKRVIEQAQALKSLDAWRDEPAGELAASAEWTDLETLPNEGVIPEIVQDKVSVTVSATGTKSASGGELYALGKMGETRLKILKSGEYKDAFVAAMRAKVTGHGIKASFMKVLQSGIDSQGGFWVPPDMRVEMIKKLATMATIRQYAFVFTTGSEVAVFPKTVYTADQRYTTGVRFNWTAEAPSSDVSESTNPVAGQVRIPIFTAIAALTATRQNIEDTSFDLLGFLAENLGEAHALGENDAYINGSGVGMPEGVLKHPSVNVANGTADGMYIASGSASALAWGNANTGVFGVEAGLPPQYEDGARWFGNKKTYASLRALNAGSAGVQWGLGEYYPSAQNGYNPTLLGSPITKDQFFPDVAGDAFPLLYGQMNGYYIPDRVGLSVEVLRETKALRDEVVIYSRKRTGGQLVKPWKLKALKIALS